jgi:hypothetical protein
MAGIIPETMFNFLITLGGNRAFSSMEAPKPGLYLVARKVAIKIFIGLPGLWGILKLIGYNHKEYSRRSQ